MKLIVHLTLLSCLFSISNFCMATSTVYPSIDDLALVVEKVSNDKVDKSSTLIIFDIDDTLLEANNFVGSGRWYSWQRGRINKDNQGNSITIEKKDQFYCMFQTLGSLFEFGSTRLTQPNAGDIVEQLKDYDFLILTARTTTFRNPTERELTLNGIEFRSSHLMKNGDRLKYQFTDDRRTSTVTYENGIAMLSGLNKGMVLQDLLKKLDKKYQHIYFVDDSEKNILNMKKYWANSDTVMNIFHYNKVDKSISQKDIQQSKHAKKHFDAFLQDAFPQRFESFKQGECH